MNNQCAVCGKPCGIWLYCSSACKSKSQSARYGHTALRLSTEDVTGTQRYTYKPPKACPVCNKLHKRRGVYCSDACKQTAYRRRRDPHSGTLQRRRERSNRAARTKAAVKVSLVCEHCECEIHISIAEGTNRRYCSNSCRQAAYRQRKALRNSRIEA